MAKPVNILAAKTHFSRLVDRAAGGEEIIIAKAGKPVARLMPLAVPTRRAAGVHALPWHHRDPFDRP
jgi:prevent-host-death family protein